MRIGTLDTTLRDGCQGRQVAFTIADKLRITERLAEFGVDYIEGGRPGACAADAEFFRRVPFELRLPDSCRLLAFGPVCAVNRTAEDDPQLAAVLRADTAAVSLFADFAELGEGGRLAQRIFDSVRFAIAEGREVLFHAAGFFGRNCDMSVPALLAAREAGASVVVLCDTDGGAVPSEVARVCAEVRRRVDGPLGIHAHNAGGVAVANTLAAVEQGFEHVEGTINGYGPRCGGADLCAVIGNLVLKLGHTTGAELDNLSDLARFVAERAHLPLPDSQPFTGDPLSHTPEALERMVHRLGLAERIPSLHVLKDRVRQLELEGYDLQAAPGTIELLVREAAYPGLRLFRVVSYEASTRGTGEFGSHTTATVALEVNRAVLSATADGNGPVHALDRALRKCLARLYPAVMEPDIVNYTLRVLDPERGSAAKARVLVEWCCGPDRWATLGVSDNIVAASWRALADGMRLELLRLFEKRKVPLPVEDASWAV